MTRTRLVVVEVVRIGQSAYADTTLPCSCLSASGRGLRSLQRVGFWADSTSFPKDTLGPPCLLFQEVWSSPVVFQTFFFKAMGPSNEIFPGVEREARESPRAGTPGSTQHGWKTPVSPSRLCPGD